MIDYKETKKAMEIRGVEFSEAQFSFALMVAIGINRYDAYKLSIVSDFSVRLCGKNYFNFKK